MKRNNSCLKVFIFCIFIVSLIFCTSTSFADIRPVPSVYPTIQDAITAAINDDIVLVDDGIYTGVGNKDLNFNGKAITVQSENGPDDCIIDCEGVGGGFYFNNSEGQDSVVSGFTIMDSETGQNAIDIFGSSPTIENCVITGNGSSGIQCGNSNPTITNCTITFNTAQYGGGIHLVNSYPTITNCTISDNTTELGTTIHCNSSSPSINGSTIADNTGGGIGCYSSSPTITDCTITGNSRGGIQSDENSSPTITDCTITGNTGDYGSGIGCVDATITNSIISGNTTTGQGYTIFCGNAIITGCTIADNNGIGINFIDSSPTITDCTITGNSHRGISGSGNAIITGCTISGNTTIWGGGGINIGGDYSPTITNCIISNNTADLDGGGIRINDNSSPMITNCTISNNTASQDGGGIYCRDDPSPTVTNSILWGNSPDEIYIAGGVITVTYSDIEGAWGGIGNIVADPLFVDPGNNDFHIQVDSLCIDAGTDTAPELPDEDFEGDPRIVGTAPDMGADEFPCEVHTYYRDADEDGYGDPSNPQKDCTLPSGYVIDNTDCDDSNANVNPGATEVCNGIDDNCDGSVDEGVTSTFYQDSDGDGYGNAAVSTQACSAPAGYVVDNTDCDDGNVAINPGATEVCDGVDNNCDGNIDEGVTSTFYEDSDGDGYGNAAVSTQACSAPAGYVADSTDCDDGNATINPGATEVCDDGIDNDCDGDIDSADADCTSGDGGGTCFIATAAR